MAFLQIFVLNDYWFYFQNIWIQCEMWWIVGLVEQIFGSQRKWYYLMLILFLFGLFTTCIYFSRDWLFLQKLYCVSPAVSSGKIVFSGVWLFGSHISWLTYFRQWSWRPQVWLKKWKHLNYDTRQRYIESVTWICFLGRTSK